MFLLASHILRGRDKPEAADALEKKPAKVIATCIVDKNFVGSSRNF
jgi:hypothetical protein